jgi:uncharacterized surface anchored protein
LLGLLTAVALLAAPAAALGAESTTTLNGYSATPTISTTSVATTTVSTASPVVTPANESKPEHESKPTETSPKGSVKPSTAESTPSTTTSEAKTLPFTGLNLAWVIGAGLLLFAAGLTIRVLQHRRAQR